MSISKNFSDWRKNHKGKMELKLRSVTPKICVRHFWPLKLIINHSSSNFKTQSCGPDLALSWRNRFWWIFQQVIHLTITMNITMLEWGWLVGPPRWVNWVRWIWGGVDVRALLTKKSENFALEGATQRYEGEQCCIFHIWRRVDQTKKVGSIQFNQAPPTSIKEHTVSARLNIAKNLWAK